MSLLVNIQTLPEEGLNLKEEYDRSWLTNIPEYGFVNNEAYIKDSIKLSGLLVKEGNNLRLRGKVEFTIHTFCSRCGEEMDYPVNSKFRPRAHAQQFRCDRDGESAHARGLGTSLLQRRRGGPYALLPGTGGAGSTDAVPLPSGLQGDMPGMPGQPQHLRLPMHPSNGRSAAVRAAPVENREIIR